MLAANDHLNVGLAEEAFPGGIHFNCPLANSVAFEIYIFLY